MAISFFWFVLLTFFSKPYRSQKTEPQAPSKAPPSVESISEKQNLFEEYITTQVEYRYRSLSVDVRINSEGHSSPITDLFFVGDGNTLISSSRDRTVRLWDISDLNNHKLLYTLRQDLNCPYGEILATSLSPNRDILAAGGIFGALDRKPKDHLVLYNLKKGKIQQLAAPSKVSDLAFSLNGKYLASGSINRTVTIRELVIKKDGHMKDDKKTIVVLKGHTLPITSVSFSKDRFASASEDGTVRLYDTGKFKLKKVLEKHNDRVTVIRFSPDGRYLLTASSDNFILLYDKNGKFIRKFASQDTPPLSLCFSPDGRHVCVGNHSGTCYLYSFPEGENICEFKGHKGTVRAVASMLRAEKVMFATGGGGNNEIILWDQEGQILSRIEGPGRSAFSLEFLGEGKIGSGMDSGRKSLDLLFDLKGLKLHPFEFNEALRRSKTYSESNYLERSVLSDDFGSKFKWDVIDIHSWERMEARIIRTEFDGYKHKCFTFIGERLIASGGLDGELFVYNLRGEKLAELVGHTGEILDVASSQEGKWLVSCSSDQTIMLWDVEEIKKKIEKRKRYSGGDIIEWENFLKIYTREEIEFLKEKINKLRSTDRTRRALINHFKSFFDQVPRNYPAITVFLTKDNGWIAWTEHGFFAASSTDLWDLAGYQVNQGNDVPPRFYSCSQLYDITYRPDLVKLRYEEPAEYQTIVQSKYYNEFIKSKVFYPLPPPNVEIASPEDGGITYSNKVKVKVKITNPDGKIGDIRLYHNGKLVSSEGLYRLMEPHLAGGDRDTWKVHISDAYGPTVYKKFIPYEHPVEKAYSIRLVSGINTIACQAMNSPSFILSGMSEVKVKSNMGSDPPCLYLLAVGVKNFKNEVTYFDYAHQNVRSLSNVIRQYVSRQYSWVQTVPLFDPTKIEIKKAFFDLRNKIMPSDTFIFYVSTFGAARGDEYYLTTSDFSGELHREVAINSEELTEFSKLIPALNQIYILDTFFSKSADLFSFDLSNRKLLAFSLKARVHLMEGSSLHRKALEYCNGHGFFTFYLLKALRGLADMNYDREVTVFEAADYIEKNLKQTSEGIKKILFSRFGKDIIITERK